MSAGSTETHLVSLSGLGPQAVLASTDADALGSEGHLLDRLVEQGALHAADADVARQLPPVRRATFVAGRVALRAALDASPLLPRDMSLRNVPLGSTMRGAPQLPSGLTGSVSHKHAQARTRAIAIAGDESAGLLGVDLEARPLATQRERPSIAPRILTARELDLVRDLEPLAHRDATVLRFSLKEAIYKAIDPIVQRYVRFTEVEVDVHDDGRTTVTLLLPEFAGSAARVDAWWQRDDAWIITTARLVR